MKSLQTSHDRLLRELKDLVKCIRNFELGDYSPLMDEIFDSESAIKEAEKLSKTKPVCIKHGIEPRFSKGRKLTLLSYAVYQNGVCQVSHDTTKHHRKYGYVQIAYNQERKNHPGLPII